MMKNILNFCTNLSNQKVFFWAIVSITIYICVVYSNISLSSSISFHFVNIQIQTFRLFKPLSSSSSSPNIDLPSSILNFKSKTNHRHYLINTESCLLEEWPLFDSETLPLFVNYSQEDFHCYTNVTRFEISRINATWIRIDFPQNENWECFATEIRKSRFRDALEYGSRIGPIGELTNFANNLTFESNDNGESRWDAVKISCSREQEYSLVVPLIQEYKPKKPTNPTNPQVNVILMGIDSISRLNFHRHMTLTKRFLKTHNFTSLEGYHKVGENTFPNILPMLTGNFPDAYYKQSMGRSFKFDDIPLIWKDFQKMGYVTTFVEDMPEWGIFVERGGFAQQPTDYYLRPVTLAIDKDLYFRENGSHPWCYKRWLEHEYYWNYMLDQFEAFKVRNQFHFTFAHLSTFTHDLLNQPGRLDRFYHKFLEQIFQNDHNSNSVIILYSDHGIRYGGILNTTASIQEQRLPFVSIYVPETLVLKGANQIREILKLNQNRLTSHFDLHATMMHVLYGKVVPEVEPYGLSLFSEIPSNRTCAEAGIKQDYCLCNSYNPISISANVRNASSTILKHMNQLMSSHGNHCVPLTHGPIYRAFDSYDAQKKVKHRLIHFQTEPNAALMEGIVEINPKTDQIIKIVGVTRISQYWAQSRCVQQMYHDIETFCYCWNAYKKDLSENEQKKV